ncbi:oxidoreductase-like domain-containing protein [Paraburkholderia sp. PREW-6R]|uniref:oxidoreductase-like domain-containing protein n=1 Tax=Paraburkholderia sp. PREW-6R TaxID=3141544 RepID=UPI0031F49DE0
MPRATRQDDPPPVPPLQPDLDDCCHSGCHPCVFDRYDEALDRYRTALAEWQARHERASRHKRDAPPPSPARKRAPR